MTIKKRFDVADKFTLPTQRTVTDEGFLITKGRVSRIGTQEYLASEMGLDGDPFRRVVAYRPPEEVFDAKSLASFQYKPIVDDHKAVDAKNWKEVAVGDMHDMQRDADDNSYAAATLVIKDAEAVAKINGGKVQLSCGYSFDADWTPGTAPDGTKYDFVQRNIRGNHLALVDAARCGSACRVSDSQPSGEPAMPRTVVVDGIPVEVNDQAAAVIEKQTKQITTLTSDVAARDAQLKETVQIGDKQFPLSNVTELRAGVAKLVGDMEALRKDVMTPEQRDVMVADWAATMTDAKRLVPGMTTDGKTCHAVRLEVLEKMANDEAVKVPLGVVLAGKAINGLDQETARTAFKLVASLKPAGSQAQDQQQRQQVGDQLLGQQPTTPVQGNDGKVEIDAAMSYQERMANAWKGAK